MVKKRWIILLVLIMVGLFIGYFAGIQIQKGF